MKKALIGITIAAVLGTVGLAVANINIVGPAVIVKCQYTSKTEKAVIEDSSNPPVVDTVSCAHAIGQVMSSAEYVPLLSTAYNSDSSIITYLFHVSSSS